MVEAASTILQKSFDEKRDDANADLGPLSTLVQELSDVVAMPELRDEIFRVAVAKKRNQALQSLKEVCKTFWDDHSKANYEGFAKAWEPARPLFTAVDPDGELDEVKEELDGALCSSRFVRFAGRQHGHGSGHSICGSSKACRRSCPGAT